MRDHLDEVYRRYDSFAMQRVLLTETARLSKHFFDNFFAMNKDTPQRRLERSEKDLVEAFALRHEFGLLEKKGAEE